MSNELHNNDIKKVTELPWILERPVNKAIYQVTMRWDADDLTDSLSAFFRIKDWVPNWW
jgi:hypothetical protein